MSESRLRVTIFAMDKREAAEKLMLIPDTEGRLTLKEASTVRFNIDEQEWLLKTYKHPEERKPSDRGPENSYFPEHTDSTGLPLYCFALDLVRAMDRFRIDRKELDRLMDMAYRTTLMDLVVKNGIKHTGASIADIKPDPEDMKRHPGVQDLLDKAHDDMQFFRDQMAIDHALWAFPEAFDMTIEQVIKHRAEEPQRICSGPSLKERYEMVRILLEN